MNPLDRTQAEAIARAVSSISGVAGMHGGRYGEVALLYPGARVRGLKFTDGVLEVHVTASLNDARRSATSPGPALASLGQRIEESVSTLCSYPIEVTIDDIVSSRSEDHHD